MDEGNACICSRCNTEHINIQYQHMHNRAETDEYTDRANCPCWYVCCLLVVHVAADAIWILWRPAACCHRTIYLHHTSACISQYEHMSIREGTYVLYCVCCIQLCCVVRDVCESGLGGRAMHACLHACLCMYIPIQTSSNDMNNKGQADSDWYIWWVWLCVLYTLLCVTLWQWACSVNSNRHWLQPHVHQSHYE